MYIISIQLLQDASLVLDAQWRETDPPVPASTLCNITFYLANDPCNILGLALSPKLHRCARVDI